MKKIFSIVLALALVLGLSLATATPVAASQVSDISVNVDPKTILTPAEYTINFTIGRTLGASSDWISIQFPEGTTVPATYEPGDVTVQTVPVPPLDIAGVDQVVTITLPEDITAIAGVTVVFKAAADIINPGTSDEYHLYVWTSKETEPGESDDYFINLKDKSTYEFVYDVPATIWRDEWAEVPVTLKTEVEGLDGYDSVQIAFNVTWAPGGSHVTFQVCDEEYQDCDPAGEDQGYLPEGPFPITKEYEETFPFRLQFDEVGMYTIKFVLLTDPDGVLLESDEAIWAVTGVSVDVGLNKGWNLMSLPVVPDNPVIEELLADIMVDVISVWYYDAAAVDWDSFDPDPELSSDLGEMEDGKAYWINMSEGRTLTVIGQAIAAPGHGTPQTYEVVEGWNMIGFKSMDPMPAKEYLNGTECVRVYGFYEGGWFSLSLSDDDAQMVLGLGYWVAFSDEGTIYP